MLVLILVLRTVSAAAPGDTTPSPPGVVTVDLQFQETDEELITQSLAVKLTSSKFRQEPRLESQEILRGTLSLISKDPMPFIWDRLRGKLYLDMNCNRDLADDPGGVFSSGSKGFSQVFSPIRLPRISAGERPPVLIQLHFNTGDGAGLNVYAGIRSFWHNKVTLRNKEWQFGLVDAMHTQGKSSPPNYLLLRPWEERDRSFNLLNGSPDFLKYSTNLFFDQQYYRLDCAYEARNGEPKFKIALEAQSVPLGEVRVIGQYLHRLILIGTDASTVVLDRPEGTERIPLGDYSLESIWVRQGKMEFVTSKAGRILIDEKRPANLHAGGPLTNSVSILSADDNLQIFYRLVGANGADYMPPQPDLKNPPEYAIFHGTNRAAAGKFSRCCVFLHSWRVPYTNATTFAVIARADLGGMGLLEGTPVLHTWEPAFAKPSQAGTNNSGRTGILLLLPVLILLGLLIRYRRRSA